MPGLSSGSGLAAHHTLVERLQRVEQGGEIGWQGGLKAHFFARCGVFEAQFRGVQSLPPKAIDDLPQGLGEPARLGRVARGGEGVGHDRMADMGEMHANTRKFTPPSVSPP